MTASSVFPLEGGCDCRQVRYRMATAPLFVTGLGLDSIDALELAVAIEKRYGVRFASNDAQNERIFSSLRSLAQHIESALLGGAQIA